jgi:hypothetical protein
MRRGAKCRNLIARDPVCAHGDELGKIDQIAKTPKVAARRRENAGAADREPLGRHAAAGRRRRICPMSIDMGREASIKSCDHRPLKRLSLIAFEHIRTQEIRGMLILICALTLALAIGACVGALMVRLRADRVAIVRRDAARGARRRPQRPTGPPASRS